MRLAACPQPSLCVCPPPRRPAAFRFASGSPGMWWHDRLVSGSPSERRWNTLSSTVYPAPPSAPPLASRWFYAWCYHSAHHSALISWTQGHATTPVTSSRCRGLRPDACKDWHEPSLRRPIGHVVSLGWGCILARPLAVPSPSSGGVFVSLLPADLSSTFLGVSVAVRARIVCCDTSSFGFPYLRLYFPSPFPVSPSVFPLISVPSCRVWGARLALAPGTGMPHRRERHCDTCIARSCTLTLARIHSRRQRQDKLNALMPWCVPPAPFSSPYLYLYWIFHVWIYFQYKKSETTH